MTMVNIFEKIVFAPKFFCVQKKTLSANCEVKTKLDK